MNIIGIHLGHNATASLLKDGKIINCVSEERFSRIKNHTGIPMESIKWILSKNNLKKEDIDYIVLDDYEVIKDPYFATNLKDYLISKRSFMRYIYKFKIIESFINLKKRLVDKRKVGKKREDMKKDIYETFGFNPNKILIIDHHTSHAYSPCFNLPKDKETLIFTLDGEGNDLCATINIWNGKNLKRIAETNKRASIGWLYAWTTLILGMKPLEHEFKVMGMAPYAKDYGIKKTYDKIKDLIWLDKKHGLTFKSKFRMYFIGYYLENILKYERFDNISGSIQKLLEKLVIKWIKNGIRYTGIKDIALSGGVFMNVKLNMKISELDEVKTIFPMPSGADESNAIGAAFFGYKKYCENNNVKFDPIPFEELYLGPNYEDDEIYKFLKQNGYDKKYHIEKHKNIEREIAKLLSKNEVVARLNGNSEFGARALGNRSILSNPSDIENIRIINEAIKKRDFWMPFTPSIMEEKEKDYIINPKNIFAPYMIITFDTTKKAKKELIAAIHPYDKTARPQIVKEKWNPSYYKIIKEFGKITGINAVLNTSFNLHGEPMVLSPRDAMHTMENSDLKYLTMGNYLISKK